MLTLDGNCIYKSSIDENPIKYNIAETHVKGISKRVVVVTSVRAAVVTSGESDIDSPKPKENVGLCSLTDKHYDSDEEVRAKDTKKMPQKSKVATAKSSPHSKRLVEEEQYKQKKGKRSVDMKEQERESELQANSSRRKLQKPHSQVKE